MSKAFDIVIVGAGPSAFSMALALKNSNLSIAILEKSVFPRDKICGDAIPYEAYQTLKRIDEKYYQQLYSIVDTSKIIYSRLVTPKGRDLHIKWNSKAFNCKRVTFDNQLFEWVKSDTDTCIYENTIFKNAVYSNESWTIETSRETFEAKVLVGAGGVNCPVARRIANLKLDRAHTSGAVRAYFKNINGIDDNTNEIYFLKDYPDSYFWIFPVGNNTYNVGFGLLSKSISNKKINVRQLFQEIIDTDNIIKKRFNNAKRLEKTTGFSIPLGSRSVAMSGAGYILLGDAAHLVEPFGGHGIGTGMWSGKVAADFLRIAFEKQQFTAKAMYQYDKKIQKSIGKRLSKQKTLQRIVVAFPFLIEIAARPYMKKIVRWLT